MKEPLASPPSWYAPLFQANVVMSLATVIVAAFAPASAVPVLNLVASKDSEVEALLTQPYPWALMSFHLQLATVFSSAVLLMISSAFALAKRTRTSWETGSAVITLVLAFCCFVYVFVFGQVDSVEPYIPPGRVAPPIGTITFPPWLAPLTVARVLIGLAAVGLPLVPYLERRFKKLNGAQMLAPEREAADPPDGPPDTGAD